MKTETEIVKKYIIRKGKTLCLNYLLIEIGNMYGIKITYKDEANEVILKHISRNAVLNMIIRLSKTFTFPIELEYILEDLSVF